jgi:pre-mRNA-splicing factor SYF2
MDFMAYVDACVLVLLEEFGVYCFKGAHRGAFISWFPFRSEEMSRDDRAAKLEALRARLDTAKAQNHADMEEEKKREMDPEYKKRAERGLAEPKAEAAIAGSKRQMRSSGMSDKVTIAQSEVWEGWAEKKKDRKAVSGGGVLSPEVQLKAFDRRASQNVKVDLAHYQKMKSSDPNFFPTADSLAVGKPYKPSKDKVDQMTSELVGQMEKRAQFSRRRSHFEEADVTYINDRNAHFNKKLQRFFGEYTQDIRDNLERGTAL